jgi:hypothetical protein
MCHAVVSVTTYSKAVIITCKCGSTRFVVDLSRFTGRKEVRQGFGGFEASPSFSPTLF